jgi:hypothetical protein
VEFRREHIPLPAAIFLALSPSMSPVFTFRSTGHSDIFLESGLFAKTDVKRANRL